nr:helix-turn-helix domain-containing protein [uncultured Noviherbaspirillum sp.]
MTEPTDYAGAQDPAEQGQPTPGMQLAMRRQEWNWTVEQVASQLNLAPRQVLAMEADDYGALPGMAVARGFIRSYAKLLKLDAVPMLAQIAKAPGSMEQSIPLRRAIPSTTFQPHRGATRARQGGPSKMLLVSGVVIAAVLAVTAFFQREQLAISMPASLAGLLERGPATADAPVAAGQTDGKVVDTDVAAPLHQAEPVSQQGAAAQAPAGMTPELSPPRAGVGSTPPAPATPATSTAQTAPAAASAAQSSNSLVLSMRQDSWVEVRRADNSTITSRVMRAGSTETFELTGPLSVTVGNASGVNATVRGAPLDLAATTRNNVARISIK